MKNAEAKRKSRALREKMKNKRAGIFSWF